ncbi:MAG: hypothetical protein LBT16_11120, partial [Treponema sp.]|nr:hypothetical protein [Treponema sp.]
MISELFLFSSALTKGATAPFRSQSAHFGVKSPFIPPIFAIPRRRLNSYQIFYNFFVDIWRIPGENSAIGGYTMAKKIETKLTPKQNLHRMLRGQMP